MQPTPSPESQDEQIDAQANKAPEKDPAEVQERLRKISEKSEEDMVNIAIFGTTF
jgi:hypothetical protein